MKTQGVPQRVLTPMRSPASFAFASSGVQGFSVLAEGNDERRS
jgi:hypothetical protein